MKQIVRAPARTSPASSSAASASADRRVPSTSSTRGGFHTASWRRGDGEPSRSTRCSSSKPVSRSASSTRVGDRGRGEQEPRRRPVGRGDPAQAPQHVGHVRPEHAAVDVGLVDDHDGEIGEQVRPRGVVGQDPQVEHVGVGQHHIGPPADLPAGLAGRVAVVDGRAHLPDQPELAQSARLVLGQCLGRVEVEGARLRVPAEHVERGQVEAQRLARGGPRGDDRGSGPGRMQGLGLVGVEPLHSCRVPVPRAGPDEARGGRPPGARGWDPRAPRAPGARPRVRRRAGRSRVGSGGSRPRLAIVEAMAATAAGRRVRARTFHDSRAALPQSVSGPALSLPRCLYLDLDGTLLGRGASLLHDGEGGVTLAGARALEACLRASVEVVLMSGRRRVQVEEDARLLRPALLRVRGGRLRGPRRRGALADRRHAPRRALDRRADRGLGRPRAAARALWRPPRVPRAVAPRSGGLAPVSRARGRRRGRSLPRPITATAACAWSTTASSTAARKRSPRSIMCAVTTWCRQGRRRRGRSPGTDAPAATRARRRWRSATRARTWPAPSPSGAFWLVANALERDATISDAIAGLDNVRVTESGYGEGVYEAAVTALMTSR